METLTPLLTSTARDHSIRRGHYDKSSDYHLEIELRTFHCQRLFPILSIIWSKNLPNWSMLCVVGQQHVDSLNYRWSWSLKINDFTSLSVNIHVSGLHTYIKKNGAYYWRHVFTFNSAKYTICSFVSTLILLVYVRIIANTSEADYLVH